MTVYEADFVCPATSRPIANGAIAVENGRIVQSGGKSLALELERRGYGVVEDAA